jgi:hypothetical protein
LLKKTLLSLQRFLVENRCKTHLQRFSVKKRCKLSSVFLLKTAVKSFTEFFLTKIVVNLAAFFSYVYKSPPYILILLNPNPIRLVQSALILVPLTHWTFTLSDHSRINLEKTKRRPIVHVKKRYPSSHLILRALS